MKNLVRAFVVALTVTGAVASAHTTRSAVAPTVTKPSAFPIPSCPPDDPNACGMGNSN